MNLSKNPSCQECGEKVASVPTCLEYKNQEIFLFDPAVCQPCLKKLCEKYSTECANCGGTIPPYSNVGILNTNTLPSR